MYDRHLEKYEDFKSTKPDFIALTTFHAFQMKINTEPVRMGVTKQLI